QLAAGRFALIAWHRPVGLAGDEQETAGGVGEEGMGLKRMEEGGTVGEEEGATLGEVWLEGGRGKKR
uniref:hypothetical protein n=1 Tax=Dermacoccus nishinomiyaensis TaxID=1274 RepID=UPI001C92CC21